MIHARSPPSPFLALELPVTLRIHNSAASPCIIDTRTMVDSGARCRFINPQFVTEQAIPTVCKKKPMHLRTIDNSEIRSGLILEEVHLRMVLGEHAETLVFDVGRRYW